MRCRADLRQESGCLLSFFVWLHLLLLLFNCQLEIFFAEKVSVHNGTVEKSDVLFGRFGLYHRPNASNLFCTVTADLSNGIALCDRYSIRIYLGFLCVGDCDNVQTVVSVKSIQRSNPIQTMSLSGSRFVILMQGY